jgi:hypothetical protein
MKRKPQVVTQSGDIQAGKIKIGEVVGEYMYHNRERSSLTHEEIAGVIQQARRNGQPVLSEQIHGAVCKARSYLELNYRVTIWNLRGYGFRVATPDELAMYTARSVRRTITMADRTVRLTDIVDRKRMPQALRIVFEDNKGRIKTLGFKGKKFMSTFIDYMKQEKVKQLKENKDAKTNSN